MEFFAGNCSLGQDMGNKGNFSVSTSLLAENGTYYLTAVATDVDGNRVTSDCSLDPCWESATCGGFCVSSTW